MHIQSYTYTYIYQYTEFKLNTSIWIKEKKDEFGYPTMSSLSTGSMLKSPSIDLTSYSHVNMGEVLMISSCFYRSNHVKSPSSSFCQFNVLLQYPCPGCHSATHVLLKHRSAATRQSMLISLGRKLGPVSPWYHHWCIFARLTIENATSYDLGVHFQEKNISGSMASQNSMVLVYQVYEAWNPVDISP